MKVETRLRCYCCTVVEILLFSVPAEMWLFSTVPGLGLAVWSTHCFLYVSQILVELHF